MAERVGGGNGGLRQFFQQGIGIGIDQPRRRYRPFEKASQANKMPAFAMVHRSISQTLDQLDAFFHPCQKAMWLGMPYPLDRVPLDLKIEPVHLFPHLRTDLLAYLACVLARAGDTRG